MPAERTIRQAVRRGIAAALVAGFAAGCSSYAPDRRIPWADPAPVHRETRRAARAEHTLNTAWTLAADGHYAKAEGVLMRWLAAPEPKDNATHAKALFWLGYCRQRQGHTDEARQTYDLLIDRFGAGAAAEGARRQLRRLADR